MLKEDLIERKIVPYLKKTLPAERMNHVRGAMALSEKLAREHGVNSLRAKLAAALHDCARCWSEKKLIQYAQEKRLQIPDGRFVFKHCPLLLHSFVGADLARRLFQIKDRKILSAVSKHSIASVKMNDLEKLIYLADLLSPDRNFPEVSRLRRLAFLDLHGAFVEAIRVKMVYLLNTRQLIHPQAVQVWNHFVKGNGK